MNQNIKYCVGLSHQRRRLKKCINITSYNDLVIEKILHREMKEFHEALISLREDVIKIELRISNILTKQYPELVIPERFHLSSYDIKSRSVSLTDLKGNLKSLSLDSGEVTDEAEDELKPDQLAMFED